MSAEIIVIYCIIHKLFVRACFAYGYLVSLITSLSGTPNSISLSNLPGLRNAGSIAFTRLVAPMTTTLPLEERPSIKDNSWDTIRRSTSPETSLFWSYRIEFIDKKYRWRILLCLLKHVP